MISSLKQNLFEVVCKLKIPDQQFQNVDFQVVRSSGKLEKKIPHSPQISSWPRCSAIACCQRSLAAISPSSILVTEIRIGLLTPYCDIKIFLQRSFTTVSYSLYALTIHELL